MSGLKKPPLNSRNRTREYEVEGFLPHKTRAAILAAEGNSLYWEGLCTKVAFDRRHVGRSRPAPASKGQIFICPRSPRRALATTKIATVRLPEMKGTATDLKPTLSRSPPPPRAAQSHRKLPSVPRPTRPREADHGSPRRRVPVRAFAPVLGSGSLPPPPVLLLSP